MRPYQGARERCGNIILDIDRSLRLQLSSKLSYCRDIATLCMAPAININDKVLDQWDKILSHINIFAQETKYSELFAPVDIDGNFGAIIHISSLNSSNNSNIYYNYILRYIFFNNHIMYNHINHTLRYHVNKDNKLLKLIDELTTIITNTLHQGYNDYLKIVNECEVDII